MHAYYGDDRAAAAAMIAAATSPLDRLSVACRLLEQPATKAMGAAAAPDTPTAVAPSSATSFCCLSPRRGAVGAPRALFAGGADSPDSAAAAFDHQPHQQHASGRGGHHHTPAARRVLSGADSYADVCSWLDQQVTLRATPRARLAVAVCSSSAGGSECGSECSAAAAAGGSDSPRPCSPAPLLVDLLSEAVAPAPVMAAAAAGEGCQAAPLPRPAFQLLGLL